MRFEEKLKRCSHPRNLDELRRMLPLTSYADYADVLLAKRTEMLCGEPAVWIQTTWEGGPSSWRPIPAACWIPTAITSSLP